MSPTDNEREAGDDGSGGSAARPVMIGRHRCYLVGPRVQVMEYEGDVTLEQIRQLIALTKAHPEPFIALVRDVKRLGRFSLAARREFAKHGAGGLGDADVELRIYVSNTNVVTRATLRLVFNAILLMTRRKISVHTPATLEQAIELATRYADEVSRRAVAPT